MNVAFRDSGELLRRRNSVNLEVSFGCEQDLFPPVRGKVAKSSMACRKLVNALVLAG